MERERVGGEVMRGKEEMGRSGEGKSWWRGQERERGDGEVRREGKS